MRWQPQLNQCYYDLQELLDSLCEESREASLENFRALAQRRVSELFPPLRTTTKTEVITVHKQGPEGEPE
ncbi:MAG: hypothetical protein ACD_57C00262G0002 [uncultured bacterium]|uniref:Uncharacterized protein n=1 Tax=Candidatus Woesebacteria bacterium RIFCSPHIGHO2_12_FULL_41_24 TaxID=1802510 RepID=A0A1F8AUC6_9BACT|nr:MAG: hypothetical protein ACD_57C00262G0002 [uncultured bacterium]OGM14381.1 MAG: hypothetical protein A2W15_02420 [Candidatus Woesebacteria bacterium RBG_16_41_13]OGM30758.1 MAG: hypothetical protein A2873_03410 [Candidatus Woesebacteria bacterium RIFCSPHIGHO2_01_FULL_42_80]OGM34180.1 MAG: hypothetical protein A3D84_04180 [Candidatus Woesebacteria bacterium RIFCSPHIGHO2_02_FULL_42_20]OGM55363.1 MAG: hypothetical protein A3E44_03715 [Candidatus Woesebacteria bacterium RIFCSPHIGHO2_12_FULL_41